MKSTLRKFASTEAAEIAEAALVLPIVFMFLLGIVWFGRAFQIYSTITQAAQQGAVLAARSQCATCGGGFPDDPAVENAVFSIFDASHLDRTQIMQFAPSAPQPCPDSIPAPPMVCPHYLASNISVCRSVWLNPSADDPPYSAQCGTIVSFQYPFQFSVPFISLSVTQITMRAQAQSRMEN